MKKIQSFGVMIDCSRDAVYTVESLKLYFSILAKMGFTSVQLYTEDTYEVENEPYFGYMRGKYSTEELKELDSIAREQGLELIPCIQTLAHLGGIARWDDYKSHCIDTGDILLAEEKRTYELIENMIKTCAECFTSRRINIGMDEAHMVGLGKYLDLHGYENRFGIILKHLSRVNEIVVKYGFRPMMWSDMFFRLANEGDYYNSSGKIPQEVIGLIPENVELVYWDYYHTEREFYDKMLKGHKQFRNKIIYAGGAWSWSGFAPVNRFSIRANEAAIDSCLENNVDEVFITCWKDDGAECSLFASLPVLMCAAERMKGNTDRKKIESKFRNITGIDLDDFIDLDLVNLNKQGIDVQNPCKYMLYSDPFLGIFDRTVEGIRKQEFTEVRDMLLRRAKNVRFGYIFKTLAALCEVLEIKIDLGVRTRSAYRNKDKNMLLELVFDYEELEKRLEEFYRCFKSQWEKECKLNGFEKHDIRLGGLIRRIKHCREILEEYCKGSRKSIPPLEEDILPIDGNEPARLVNYNEWISTAMIKPYM